MKRTLITTCAILGLWAGSAAAEPAKYATPYDAMEAMVAGLQADDRSAMMTVFGEEAADYLADEDPIENRVNRLALLTLYNEGYRLVPEEDGSVTIALGEESWPFPVPIAKTGDGMWSFDNEAGREEVTAREIGRNELDVIELLEAYVAIQSEFRQTDYDKDGVMEFARQIISSSIEAPDGLFWPNRGTVVGELLARASATGFNDGENDREPEPYVGYYFRILTAQGDAAPGGAMDYVIGGNMVGGHALLAVPAEYGESGVHSFMVSENGIILEAILGDDTLEVAAGIDAYNPTDAWTPVEVEE